MKTNKMTLLLALLLGVSALNGMEVPKPQQSEYMAMLPTEIKKVIILILAQSDTLEEAVNAIRMLSETSKEFYRLTINVKTTRTIIRLLAQKFNVPSAYIAQQLSTPASNIYISLSTQFMIALFQPNFDAAEELLQAGADIDFQPVDTYPIFCSTESTIYLLDLLSNAIFLKTQITQGQQFLSMIKEGQATADEEVIKRFVESIEPQQQNLASWTQAIHDTIEQHKNIFINDEELNNFKSMIKEEKFKEALAIIKPKELISYKRGITAYYKVEETDKVCAIGAHLSPVMYAIANNNLKLLQWLLEHKASLDLYMGTGDTALQMAFSLGNKEIVELLIKNGANVNQKSISPVSTEIREKFNDESWLDFRNVDKSEARVPYSTLDLNILQSIMRIVHFGSETPLISLLYSAEHFTDQELYDVFKLMLDNGANPNIQNASNDTPLIILTSVEYEGAADLMKLLLAYGADPSIKDKDGLTALDLMKFEETEEDPEREEKIELLEKAIKKQSTVVKTMADKQKK